MSEPAAPTGPLPFPESRCHRCASHRYVATGKGSLFVMCTALAEKYPRQPVRFCPAFAGLPTEPSPPRPSTAPTEQDE